MHNTSSTDTSACAQRDTDIHIYLCHPPVQNMSSTYANLTYCTNFKAFRITLCFMNSISLFPFFACLWTSSILWPECLLGNLHEIREIPASVHYVPSWFILAINKLNIDYVSCLHNESISNYIVCVRNIYLFIQRRIWLSSSFWSKLRSFHGTTEDNVPKYLKHLGICWLRK